MDDKKTKLTKDQLIDKINNERQTFKRALQDKDKETQAQVAQVRQVADLILGKVCMTFGVQQGDEYIIEIEKPTDLLAVGAEKIEGGYRIRAKKIKLEE